MNITNIPEIFISHASNDRELAFVLKDQLQTLLNIADNQIFVSSAPSAIAIGEQWLETIIKKLQTAKTLIVLITPTSISRRWVWFEIGYFWSKKDRDDNHIYPIYTPAVHDIPHPLGELQAKSLGDCEEIRDFLKHLVTFYGIPQLENKDYEETTNKLFEFSNTSGTLESTSDKQIVSDEKVEHLAEDEEYIEMLNEYLRREYEAYQEQNSLPNLLSVFSYTPSKPNVYAGRLLYYEEIDERLRLPSGITKKYLIDIASEHGLIPKFRGERTVKFSRERKGS